MPKCSKCGKLVTSAPMVCGECRRRWISVKDRLPEHEGAYIVYMDGSDLFIDPFDIYFVNICIFRNGKFTEKVSHWMPLPEPPEENT